jgi:hypothetical protein
VTANAQKQLATLDSDSLKKVSGGSRRIEEDPRDMHNRLFGPSISE